MTKKTSFSSITLISACTAIAVAAAAVRPAQAQEAASATADAATHFRRAVQLYAEADYRAALVEFKRAYELAPNATVLYNIGETYYQLQNYAGALDAFQKFLAQGGSAHRADVESAVTVLRARVGRIEVTSSTPGWEIAIDDEPVGKTPLSAPLSVSVGRRKVTAMAAREPAQTKYVDVAAGETRAVNIISSLASAPASTPAALGQDAHGRRSGSSDGLLVAGWITTSVLGAGAIASAIVAASESASLKNARKQYPADQATIESKSSATLTTSILADSLGGAAVVLGALTFYFQVTKPSSTASTSARVGVAADHLLLEGTF